MGGRHREDSDPEPVSEPERAGRPQWVRAAVYGWLERTSFSRAGVFLAGGVAMLVLLGTLMAASGVFGRGGSPAPRPERLAEQAPDTTAPIQTPRVRPAQPARTSPRPSTPPVARSDRTSPTPRTTRRPTSGPTAGLTPGPTAGPRKWPRKWPRHHHGQWPSWWFPHHPGGHR